MFFQLSTWVLALALFAVIVGATALGLWIGRSVRHNADSLREPFGVMQAALLVTLILVVTFDLDRPTRGLIRVPATPLIDVRQSMALPPPAPAGR